MRFLRLEFQAFGSYPRREVIDFTVLEQKGLFVVTGPTGSGKTTIFDALTYALFNELPGERSGQGAEHRSQHARPDDRTEVTLDFEVSGTHYRVTRTPQQERQKLKGSGTTKDGPTASLVKVVNGTEQPVTSGAKEVTTECVALAGLSASEFQRVVLLPQGRFTQFLIATEGDREELLSQLFDGQTYKSALAHLKAEKERLGIEVSKVDNNIQHHRSNALAAINAVRGAWADLLGLADDSITLTIDTTNSSFEAIITDAIDAAAPALTTARERYENTKKDRDAARQALDNVLAQQARFDKRAEAQSERAALDQTREATHHSAAAAEISKKARPVVSTADAYDRADEQHREASAAYQQQLDELAEILQLLAITPDSFEPTTLSKAAADRLNEINLQRTLLKAKEVADQEVADIDGRLTAAITRTDDIQQVLDSIALSNAALTTERDSLIPLAGELERSAQQLATAEAAITAHDEATAAAQAAQAATDTFRKCSDEYQELLLRFIAGAAPRLAAQLQPEQACPVCGSLEHPAPALVKHDQIVEQADLDAASNAIQHADDKVTRANNRLTEARVRLGDDLTVSLDDLAVRVTAAAQQLSRAQQATARCTDLTAEINALDERRRNLEVDLAAATTQQTTEATRLESAQKEQVRLGDLTAQLDPQQLTLLHESASEAQRRIDTFGSADREKKSAADLAGAAAERARDALATSGFSAVAEARDALMSEADEAAAAEAARTWEATSASVDATLSMLADVPDVRPDHAATLDSFTAADIRAREAEDHYAPIKVHYDSAVNSLDAAKAELDSARDLYERHLTAQVVFKTCNGEAGGRVKLQQWVLGTELERVTIAANVHLARMTQHRYALRRPEGNKSALGLEVFDASTGLPRGTRTLSGGEQFQASLALALGLADVISWGGAGNGKRFDALFIDEGFGSLDAAALDEAIDTLRKLHATGRMVGAITHVEAMKTELPIGIEVTRLPDGKGSTLTVVK